MDFPVVSVVSAAVANWDKIYIAISFFEVYSCGLVFTKHDLRSTSFHILGYVL